MSIKTAGVGHFAIPTAPAAGVSCTSGAANTFTTTYVQLTASTGTALYITGIFVESAAALGGTYDVVQLATGAAASEVVVGQYLISLSTGSTVATGYRPIWPPIPVPISTRIACKTADSVGAKATLITLECLAQSNYVDDAVAVTTVTNLTNAPTAGDLTATMKTSVTTAATAATPALSTAGNAAVAAATWRDTVAGDFTVASSVGLSVMNGVALGTGLKVNDITTKTGYSISGTVNTFDGLITSENTAHGAGSWATATGFATPTNITAASGVALAASQHVIVDSGTITTYTGNTPQTGDAFARLGLAGAGLTALGDTRIANLDAAVSSRSTYAGGAVASVTGAVGSVTSPVTVGTNNDKTGYALTQAFPANFANAAIAATGEVSADVKKVNATTVNGAGTVVSPWGP